MAERRCIYCFGVCRDTEELRVHMDRGLCLESYSQPPQLLLPESGARITHNDLRSCQTYELTVVLDTESRLIPVGGDGNIAGNILQGLGAGPWLHTRNNVVQQHAPKSVGMLYLDFKYDKIEYDHEVSYNVIDVFGQKVTDSISQRLQEINRKLYPDPVLTLDNVKHFTKQKKMHDMLERIL